MCYLLLFLFLFSYSIISFCFLLFLFIFLSLVSLLFFRKYNKFTNLPQPFSRGLNQGKPCTNRTVFVAIDLSKALDTINHAILFEDIANTSLPPSLKRWIVNYMCGRQSYVEFRDTKCKPRRVKQGVAQGGVISPLPRIISMPPNHSMLSRLSMFSSSLRFKIIRSLT